MDLVDKSNVLSVLRAIATTALAATVMLSGCGSSGDPGPNAASSHSLQAPMPADPIPQARVPVTADPVPSDSSPTLVTADEHGRRMIGEIPYDVWFDDPLGILANDSPLQPPDSTDVAPTVTTIGAVVPTAADASSAGVSDGTDWMRLITAETLDAEVRNIRNSLDQRLRSVGAFNQSIFEIPPQAATLAALSAVAIVHAGDVRWKDRAGYIRDLSGKMNAEPLQRGAKLQRTLLDLFEDITDTLSGSPPTDFEPAGSVEFHEVAEMRQLMKRIELGFNRLKTDAGNEQSFRSEAGMVRHEAAILATLMQIITTEGYGYSDDDEFLAHARPAIDSCVNMVSAADDGSFETYDAGLSRVTRACTECHSEYRND